MIEYEKARDAAKRVLAAALCQNEYTACDEDALLALNFIDQSEAALADLNKQLSTDDREAAYQAVAEMANKLRQENLSLTKEVERLESVAKFFAKRERAASEHAKDIHSAMDSAFKEKDRIQSEFSQSCDDIKSWEFGVAEAFINKGQAIDLRPGTIHFNETATYGINVYVVTKKGINTNIVIGVFDSFDRAKNVAIGVSETDYDDYHDYSVQSYKMNASQLAKLVGPNSHEIDSPGVLFSVKGKK